MSARTTDKLQIRKKLKGQISKDEPPHDHRRWRRLQCSRLRLWKWSLQQLADETGLIIQVCHYPPGTSKWNKIEHRMFCFITQNWRAMPLASLYVVIALIATAFDPLRPRS